MKNLNNFLIMEFILISKKDDYIVIKTTSSNLAIHVQQWKHQRPIDDQRVVAIMDDIQKKGRVQPVISLVQYPGQALVCIDGGHRLEALKRLHQQGIFIEDVFATIFYPKTDEDLKEECK